MNDCCVMCDSNANMMYFQIKDYDGVQIENFHKSFQDGKAFAALINKYSKSILDYNAVKKVNRYAWMQQEYFED